MATRRVLASFVNRNPRNLEVTRVERRPTGWDFEVHRDKRNFTYKAILTSTKSHTDAVVVHHRDGVIVSASTREPAIAHQLHSTVDTSAAHNIGRVLALRCQQSGITACISAVDADEVERSDRKKAFFKALSDGGIALTEPATINHTHENDPNFTWRRFDVKHTREDRLDEDPVIRK